jgi:hypothetical protein
MTRLNTPCRVGTTSFIYPDHILPNVRRLAPRVDDIEILLFDISDPADLPGEKELDELGSVENSVNHGFRGSLSLSA